MRLITAHMSPSTLSTCNDKRQHRRSGGLGTTQ